MANVQQNRKRVLIVDDDPATLSMLASILDQSYSVQMANNGLDGLRAALAAPPDLIITDVTMPGLDGISMVQRLRERCVRKIPVIFLTAHDDPVHTIAGISAGARHYMAKPVDLAKLESHIRNIMK